MNLAPKEGNWEIRTRLSLTCYLLSIDFFNSGDFSEAEVVLGQAIEANPKVAEYHVARGRTRYYLGGKYRESYEDYKRALELGKRLLVRTQL